MILTLDRNALFALIDKDPEFGVSLKQAVMAEVARRMFEKDASKIIAAAEPALFAQAAKAFQETHDIAFEIGRAIEKTVTQRTGAFGTTLKLSTDAQSIIDQGKENAVAGISSKIASAVGVKVREIIDSGEIEQIVERRTNSVISVEIERMVKEKLEQRLAAARAAIA